MSYGEAAVLTVDIRNEEISFGSGKITSGAVYSAYVVVSDIIRFKLCAAFGTVVNILDVRRVADLRLFGVYAEIGPVFIRGRKVRAYYVVAVEKYLRRIGQRLADYKGDKLC